MIKTLTMVIGGTATGKTTFIKKHYADRTGITCLNVLDYQDRAYKEAGYLESIPFGARFRCLMKANNELLQDVIESLKNGDEIVLRMDPPISGIVKKAREEPAEESERISKEDEAKQKKRDLLESMHTRPFWHYCEVCGKKEYLTAQEAYDSGWDYPPNFGSFGMLSQRKCGDCWIDKTLCWKVTTAQKLPIVFEDSLSESELRTWRRIKGEPESLLEDEED